MEKPSRQVRREERRRAEQALSAQHRALNRGERLHARVMFLLEKNADLEARLTNQEQVMQKVLQALVQAKLISVQTETGIVVAGLEALKGVPLGSLPGLLK